MATASPDERRRHTRYPENVCAWIAFQRDKAAYGTLTLDIGIEGARFSTHRPISKNDQISVRIQLDPSQVECRGTVCWSSEDAEGYRSFGVRFEDLSEEAREGLRRFLSDIDVLPPYTPLTRKVQADASTVSVSPPA